MKIFIKLNSRIFVDKRKRKLKKNMIDNSSSANFTSEDSAFNNLLSIFIFSLFIESSLIIVM